jgi:putative ABC transport system permease protein
VAFPPDTTLFQPRVIAGHLPRAGEADAVAINTALAAKGNRLGGTLDGRRIVGILREPLSPSASYIVRIPAATNSLRVQLQQRDGESIDRVKAALETNLAAEGVRVRGSSSQAESRYSFDQHMLMIYVFLIVVSAVIALVGGLGLMTTMSLNVLERRREMGVLRAIGAAPAKVGLIVVTEAIAIGVLSWIIATIVAWPISEGIGRLLLRTLFRSGLDFTFAPSGPAIWLVVSLVVGATAGFVPAWQAAKAPVREALDYE